MTVKFKYNNLTMVAKGTARQIEAVNDYIKSNNQHYKYIGRGYMMSYRRSNPIKNWTFNQDGRYWTVKTQVQGD